MMSNEIEKVEVSTELTVHDQFAAFEKQANEWKEKAEKIKVTDASQTDLMESAKQAQSALSKIRISVEKRHKELKEDSLRYGQTLDSEKRKILELIKPTEDYLKDQVNFVSIQEGIAKDQRYEERLDMIKPYMGDDAKFLQLGEMSEESFQGMLDGQKFAKSERERKQKEEVAAKLKLDEDFKKEQDRIRAENEKLRKENEAKNQQIANQKAIADGKLKKERDERIRLELQAKEKSDKEDADRKAKLVIERKLKRAPDKAKLNALAEQIALIPLPDLKEDDSKIVLKNVQVLLAKVVKYIGEQTESL